MLSKSLRERIYACIRKNHVFCLQVCKKQTCAFIVVMCLDHTSRPCSCIHPVGFSCAGRSLDAAPRREDNRAKEGPCLTAPGNDSLQMLCRVTSANHNNPFKPPKKMRYKEQGHGLFSFSAHIMRPRDKHLQREEESEERLLEVQLCFMQMNQ